ncbi:MAG TPA: aminoacyl-tRNA hydrolase [Bacteroidota bacterium]|nr:aminoacyl-tRNA hydrolase [Bacteroidota bacterium]
MFFDSEESHDALCIVGLGNPGRPYEATRHNVGYNVILTVAREMGIPLREGNGEYLAGERTVGERGIRLALPTTFMNESGIAVAQLSEHFNLRPAQFLIVYDDFQLPLGTLRIRPEGSDGGHNGMASVIEHLLTDRIPRLRAGIAGPTCPVTDRKDLMAAYVLSPFEEAETASAKAMVARAAEATRAYIERGIEFAMNNFNRSPEEETGASGKSSTTGPAV